MQRRVAREHVDAIVRAAKKRTRRRRLEERDRRRLDAVVEPITPEELVERFQLRSSALVEELHAIVLRQLQAEDVRESRLDGKAQTLLGTSGLAVTVAFTFGGLLLEHTEYLKSLGDLGFGRSPIYVVLFLYVLALILGLVSSFYAIGALYIRDHYRAVSERDILLPSELSAADELETDDDSRWRYRRYVTAHYWQIWQRHHAVHEGKARKIKRGQGFFLAFLASLLLIGFALAVCARAKIQAI